MLLRILKKDMMKRKGVNIILFLFITLSTVFLASSLNNIIVVLSAVDYYLDYANVPDINVVMNSEQDIDKIDRWLEQKKESGDIETYDYNRLLQIADKSVTIKKDGVTSELNNDSSSLYLATADVDYCQVFDVDGEKIHLKDGEIALSVLTMEKAGVKAGDHLTIVQEGAEKEFTVKEGVKDAAFGNEMVGMSRFMLSENDFKFFEDITKDKLGMYYIETESGADINDQIYNQSFTGVMSVISIDTYKLVYSFDMIMAGLLILIGICLILIALLVLRFTLVFSLEEQYQEIGVLKAIGFRDYAIKRIYLVKYLAIVLAGAAIGTVISVPVGQIMIDSVSENMILASSELNVWINILCAFIIIGLVVAFCYLCTRKLSKVSAITAIRGGYTGERFHGGRRMPLSRSLRMRVPFYLGLNDILSQMTRYIVLSITFCLSFILITIPLNTLNTMKSAEMVGKFNIDPDASIYISKIEEGKEEKYNNATDLLKGIERVEHELKEKGYEARMTALPIYFINYESEQSTRKTNIMSIQMIGEEKTYSQYSEGEAPMLENEIAFSQDIMEEQSWGIGDHVTARINGEEKSFVISGTYSDYMQLGKSARLNPVIDCNEEIMFDYWAIMVDIDTEHSQAELAKKLQKEFPDYEWNTAQELVDQQVGGVQGMVSEMLLPMTLLLCAVIMLITLLMEKLFVTREKGEIAMMKSIGFRHSTIRNWQIIRMVIVVVASMIISIPLSLVSNHFVLKPIFGIMGAEVSIQVNPIQAYLIYPGILLIGIIIAATIAANGVKKIDIREMNSLE